MTSCSACNVKSGAFSCDKCGRLVCEAYDCSGLSSTEIRCMELKRRSLLFYCKSCLSSNNTNDLGFLESLLNEKMEKFFTDFNSSFGLLRNDMLKMASQRLSEPHSGADSFASYAKAASKNLQQSVVVKPKDTTQKNSQTKIDLIHGVNPVSEDIKINTVKHIRNGGLVVGCKDAEDAGRLVKMVGERLSSKYDIHQLKKISPRIRVAGMSERYDAGVLQKCIIQQNDDIFSESFDCKVLDVKAVKKKNDVFQATVQLDCVSYQRILDAGYLVVGLDVCRVYDAVELIRCFRCNGFNHTSKSCKHNRTCPRCGEDHELQICSVSDSGLCCVNCKAANKNKNASDLFDTKHAAWDYEVCSVYKFKLSKLKSDLFGAQ